MGREPDAAEPAAKNRLQQIAQTFRSLNTFSALRHRNFRLFFIGQFFSLIGTWMGNTARGWLVVLLAAPALSLNEAAKGTGDAGESQASFYLSLVAIATSLPVLLGSLYGGIVADRYPKRDIIIWTQAAQAIPSLILAALIFFGQIAVWHVVLFAA
ncbi:MAG: hypothetical protein OHK0029_42630 [Armatimonadaceae bacterium]